MTVQNFRDILLSSRMLIGHDKQFPERKPKKLGNGSSKPRATLDFMFGLQLSCLPPAPLVRSIYQDNAAEFEIDEILIFIAKQEKCRIKRF